MSYNPSFESLSRDLTESIRSFVYAALSGSQNSDDQVLHVEAQIRSETNTKKWSKAIDIRQLTRQIASPPLSPARDDGDHVPQGWTDPTSPPLTDKAPNDSNGEGSNAQNQCRQEQDHQSSEVQTSRPETETRKRHQPAENVENDERPSKRPKPAGGSSGNVSPNSARQLENSENTVPQRKKQKAVHPKMQPSTLDKLITGIWENLYKKNDRTRIDPATITDLFKGGSQPGDIGSHGMSQSDFQSVNALCSRITRTSSFFRGLEIIVQARWLDCFDARVRYLVQEHPEIAPTKHSKSTLMEACRDFGFSEKELRNKMAIWKGYSELKEVAGWSALIFSGAGIYRFCKYRIGFDANSLGRVGRLRWRFELAADTMHPGWRKMLDIIGVQSRKIYHGHPLDWVVSRTCDPVPLPLTYRQWDRDFKFEHLDDSVLEKSVFGDADPRRLQHSGPYICQVCENVQSADPKENLCQCFPELFGLNRQSPLPVQVFATEDGRNNGLIACCDFPRGTPIGEFLGQITRGLSSVDVMTSPIHNPACLSPLYPLEPSSPSPTSPSADMMESQQAPLPQQSYQIFQGRMGNYTRFVNHSCLPNSQYQKFSWLGLERIVLVSKGIAAGSEITTDYSERYWNGLAKKCLCGKACCRYK